MTRREEIELAWLNKEVQSNHRYDEKSFKEAVEWADKTMIEKTISWFYKNAHNLKYWDKDGCLLITVIMNDYRQAMEE